MGTGNSLVAHTGKTQDNHAQDDPGTLWSPTQERHKTIMRKMIRDLSETPIKLLRKGKEKIFKKVIFAAADKHRYLIQLPKPDDDQDKQAGREDGARARPASARRDGHD
eukprot:5325553-Prymnesium_polylepis.1